MGCCAVGWPSAPAVQGCPAPILSPLLRGSANLTLSAVHGRVLCQSHISQATSNRAGEVTLFYSGLSAASLLPPPPPMLWLVNLWSHCFFQCCLLQSEVGEDAVFLPLVWGLPRDAQFCSSRLLKYASLQPLVVGQMGHAVPFTMSPYSL